MAALGVGVNNINVADIDDPNTIEREVCRVVLVIVSASVTEGEKCRRLADSSRAEARAGAVLRAHIVWNAYYGDVRLNALPVCADRPLAEAAMADEGKVKSALLVAVLR